MKGEILLKIIKALSKLNFSCVCCAKSSCNKKNDDTEEKIKYIKEL